MALILPVYLDHHATTPVDPRVVEAMAPFWSDDFGNASSSTHVWGWRAEETVAIARESLAAAIGAGSADEIVFTSGTTESDNLALTGVARAQRRSGKTHLVTSAIEHPAVLDTCRALEREGFALSVLPVDENGCVAPQAVSDAIREETLLVSVMAANGELGTLQPLEAIGRICRERDVLFHTDAAQAVGKVPIDVEALQIDLLSMCAHKLYGPKGVGLLYVRNRRPEIRLEPLLHGGGHERGRRSGTLPVGLIAGFAKAVELCLIDREPEAKRLVELRDHFWARLSRELGDVFMNGHPERRLPGNLSVSFAGLNADALISGLPQVALSAGSACSSGSGEPSHVLQAIGLDAERARSTVRFGLGRGNDREQLDWVADRLIGVANGLRG